uniref:CSN8/PSMD8/EIF3K domain-containing protein n=1 Tax=Meloidogyne floridensis TaxID=298350 RepID=A0A915P5V9_9BILA
MPTIESSHRQLLNEYSKQNFTVIGRILEDIQNEFNEIQIKKGVWPSLNILKDYYEIKAIYLAKEGKLIEFGQAIKDVEALYEAGINDGKEIFDSKQKDLIMGNPFFAVPARLGLCLTEGAYNSINLAENDLPTPYYKPFMNSLKESIKNEIAESLEISYRAIPVNIAMKKLSLKNNEETLAFGNKRGWILKGNEFLVAGKGTNFDDQKMPTLALASGAERVLQPLNTEQSLKRLFNYSSHLERIV